jgi:hypothetical protein
MSAVVIRVVLGALAECRHSGIKRHPVYEYTA